MAAHAWRRRGANSTRVLLARAAGAGGSCEACAAGATAGAIAAGFDGGALSDTTLSHRHESAQPPPCSFS